MLAISFWKAFKVSLIVLLHCSDYLFLIEKVVVVYNFEELVHSFKVSDLCVNFQTVVYHFYLNYYGFLSPVVRLSGKSRIPQACLSQKLYESQKESKDIIYFLTC